MSVSERLKKLIEESEYSFEQLGELTGVAKSSLQRYASGDTKKIPIDAIEAVAPFLGVSAAYLMGWDEEPKPDLRDLQVALFGGDGEVTDEMWEEAQFAAQLIKDRHKRKKGGND